MMKQFLFLLTFLIPSLSWAGIIDVRITTQGLGAQATIPGRQGADGIIFQIDPLNANSGITTNEIFGLDVPGGSGGQIGLNTISANGPQREFNTKAGAETRRISEIPQVQIGNRTYLEFILDLNEASSQQVSIDAIELYASLTEPTSTAVRDYAAPTGTPGSRVAGTWATGPNPRLAFEAELESADVDPSSNFIAVEGLGASGSGYGEYVIYIDLANFTASEISNDAYLIFYTEMGFTSTGAAGGFDSILNGESSIITVPPAPIPEPSTILFALLGLTGGGIYRFRKKKSLVEESAS